MVVHTRPVVRADFSWIDEKFIVYLAGLKMGALYYALLDLYAADGFWMAIPLDTPACLG